MSPTVSLLSFGDALPLDTSFIYPDGYVDCSPLELDGWIRKLTGTFEGKINGKLVAGPATAHHYKTDPVDKVMFHFNVFEFDQCARRAQLSIVDVNLKASAIPQLASLSVLGPKRYTNRPAWPGASGNSDFTYLIDDQVLRRYEADTTAAYAPGIIIDKINKKRMVVTGRTAGRFTAIVRDYDPYANRFSDTLLIEDLRFQAYLYEY